jgi:hypothetical protein
MARARATRQAPFHMEVDGVAAFRRGLGNARADWKKVEKAFLTEAAETVQEMAQVRARALGGVAAKSAPDIRVDGPGSLRYGGNPYNAGAEFGSLRYGQFEQWRGNDDGAGYFLWPALRQFREERLEPLWGLYLLKALAGAFPQAS